MSFWKWSRTAGTNSNADSTINWAEGQSPSSVNDSARAMMAAAAKYRDDTAGVITTGGTSTAYTVSSFQVFDTLAHLDGAQIAFVPHTTNAGSAGSQITLNVDGLGAKPVRFAPSLEIPSGTLVQGTPYIVTYNNSDGAFYLRGLGSGNPYNVPLGGMIEYTGTNAPNSSFVVPFGQAISRATYATYFSLVGTTYGAGDGSTTFNVIDKRGKASFGKDDMGGSAANLITNSGSGIVGSTLGATGGAQNVTLAQSALPNISPTWTQSGSATVAGLPNGSLNNACTVGTGNVSPFNSASTQTGTVSGIAGTISSINGGVTQTAVNKMPPAIIVNYLLRVI
jgi:microcystin-dependent protein